MTFIPHTEETTGILPLPLEHALHRLRRAWTRRKTRQALESMPLEIRKDIGWPTSDLPHDPHHRS